MPPSTESRFRRPWFWAKLAVALSVGVPLALSALILGVNCCDEALTPEILSELEFKIDDVPPEQNAYYVFAGMRAPTGKDAHAQGREYVRLVNDYFIRQNGTGDSPETARPHDAMRKDPGALIYRSPLPAPKDAPPPRFCAKTRCLPEYARQAPLIRKALAVNRELVARYRSAYRYAHFRDMVYPELAAPVVSYHELPHDTIRAAIGLQILRGDTRAAIEALRDDTQLWRRHLRESRQWEARQTAMAHISSNARLAVELVASRALTNTELRALREIFAPLQAGEKSARQSIQSRFAVYGSFFRAYRPRFEAQRCGEFWECIEMIDRLYQPNATVRLEYQYHRKRLAVASLPAPEFVRYMESPHPEDYDRLSTWSMIYNPVGKRVTWVIPRSSTHGQDITALAHNLDGLLRLTCLRIEIEFRGQRDAGIEAFLAGSPLKDPYTEQPMKWDPGKRALYFMGMEPDKYGKQLLTERIEIRL